MTGLRSWEALPDRALAGAGPEAAALLRRGMRDYRAAARFVCELPYGRNADRADYRLVLREGRGTCSTKHALLAAIAEEEALPVSLRIGIYDMDEGNTPGVGPVLAAHGLASLPEAHCYLAYRGLRVDVTRSGVSSSGRVRFHAEWCIRPEQIGDHKVSLHRAFLRDWLGRQPDLGLDLETLWRVREACIAALAETASGR